MLKKILALTCLTLSITANSATLIVSGGQLMGATDVDVDGTFYDVSFLDGSCYSLFDGCTSFVFTTLATAQAASGALLDQVFTGIYDDTPGLTFGIGAEDPRGLAITPIARTVDAVPGLVWITQVENYSLADGREDRYGRFDAWEIESDTTIDPGSEDVWASWSLSPVPVPAAAWLFGSALIGLGAIKRKRT
jgi:hypothetical protein